jgi:hypothetical protein
MTVSVATKALKRNLLIVQLLDMAPFPQGKLNGFRKAFLEADLHTNSSAGILILFRCHAVQETP